MPRIINCLNNFITTFPNNVLVNDHPEHQCSNFDKTLSIGDIIRLTTEDSFKYLMVEYTNLSVYGFNLRVQAERVAAIAIVKDTSDFTVDGWKVSKEKPIWVLGFDEWHYFFFAVFADSLNALAVGAPSVPGFLIVSPDPAAILALLSWMFL